jgi:hypothetical protein
MKHEYVFVTVTTALEAKLSTKAKTTASLNSQQALGLGCSILRSGNCRGDSELASW